MTTPKQIVLPTSPETRAKLERAGWTIDDEGGGAVSFAKGDTRIWWNHCYLPNAWGVYPAGGEYGMASLVDVLEFASILGIQTTPPGFRLVPEDEAEHAADLCLLRADECAKGGYSGWQNDVASWRKCAAALSPKEAEK